MHARLMSFRKYILDAVFEQIAATWSSHFKVDVMIKPSSLNDDTRSMLDSFITNMGGGFLFNVPRIISLVFFELMFILFDSDHLINC